MFNYPKMMDDKVVVTEKMKLNPQFFKTIDGKVFNFVTPDQGYTLKIQRNLRDDTFNMMFKDVYESGDKLFASQNNGFSPFVNVDGRDLSVGGGHSKNINHKNNNSFFVHRSMISNTKFRDVKSLSVGIKKYNNIASYRMSIYPQFETLKSNVRISEGNALEFKTVNGVTISIAPGEILSGNTSLKDEQMNTIYSYSHTLLIPRKLNRMGKNITVFDTFTYNDKITGIDMPGSYSTENDIDLHEGKIKTTSFKKSLSLVVNDIANEGTAKTEEDITNWLKKNHKLVHSPVKYVGSFNMFDQTSYDYEKKESVIGSSSTSREGEIIPYSLTGGYYRESTLGVNEIYNKINVLQSFTKLEPVLQPDIGRFELNISDTSSEIYKHLRKIDPKILIRQKDYIYPLKGLKRISHEYERLNG